MFATTRILCWTALALAIALMTLWRGAAAYEVFTYRTATDLGTELLAVVISLLTIVGMRSAERVQIALRGSKDRRGQRKRAKQ